MQTMNSPAQPLLDGSCSFCGKSQRLPPDAAFLVCPCCRVASRRAPAKGKPISLGRWPYADRAPDIGATLQLEGRRCTVVSVLDWHDQRHGGDPTTGLVFYDYRLLAEDGGEYWLECELRKFQERWWRRTDIPSSAVSGTGPSYVVDGQVFTEKPLSKSSSAQLLQSAIGYFPKAPVIDDWRGHVFHEGDPPDRRLVRIAMHGPERWYLCDEIPAPAFVRTAGTPEAASTLRIYGLIFLIFAVLTLVLHLGLGTGGDAALVLDQPLRLQPDRAGNWTSETFELDGALANVESRLLRESDYGILQAALCLVETRTLERYCIRQSLTKEDQNKAYFSKVPGGRYLLEMDSVSKGENPQYRLQLRRDVDRHARMLVVLLTMALVPLLVAIFKLRGFDGGRFTAVSFLLMAYGLACTLLMA
jgi:hypothetical protein